MAWKRSGVRVSHGPPKNYAIFNFAAADNRTLGSFGLLAGVVYFFNRIAGVCGGVYPGRLLDFAGWFFVGARVS